MNIPEYHGEEYAVVLVKYKDSDESFETVIELSDGLMDESVDDKIFYFCSGIEDLISLSGVYGVEDFVVLEVLEFTDKLY